MGLMQFLFGASPGSESHRPVEGEDRPQYGRLAERRDLAGDVRRGYWSAQGKGEAGRGEAAGRPPRIWGLRRAARRLSRSTEGGGRQPPIEIPSGKQWKLQRRLKKLSHSFAEAETPEEVREIARSARRRNPIGQWRKVQRTLRRGRESYFEKLERGGASPKDLRRAGTRYDWRIGRFERQLHRRLLRPTSRIRL